MEIKRLYKNGWSKLAIVAIAVTWIWVYFNNKLWKEDQIVWDVILYYEYLPATFIYHDITLHFIDTDTTKLREKIWFAHAPNGGRVSMTTMGMSFLYSPFFFTGHIIAAFLNEPQTGYSIPYRGAMVAGCFFYLIAGFYFLRKTLLLYFPDAVTTLVMCSVYFGTNLFYYASFNAMMPHAYLFAISCIFIYLTIQWHQKPSYLTSCYVGGLLGLLTLIRPTLCVFSLLFLFYGVYGKNSLIKKPSLFLERWRQFLLLTICSFVVIFPQLIYWKYVTGQWIFYSYPGERFYFNNPHIIDGLFSYRKGWFLYTPIMFLSVLGFIFLYKNIRDIFFPALLVFLISVYLILSWWCWWYGGGFGLRALIDFYGLLALPMGAFYQKFIGRNNIKVVLFELCLFFIALNLFQSWQHKRGIIHHDAMTKEVYWMDFGKLEKGYDWWNNLKSPDYVKAKNGEREE